MITEQFHKFGSTCHYYFRHYYNPIKDEFGSIVSLKCLTVGLKVGGEGLRITRSHSYGFTVCHNYAQSHYPFENKQQCKRGHSRLTLLLKVWTKLEDDM